MFVEEVVDFLFVVFVVIGECCVLDVIVFVVFGVEEEFVEVGD